MVVDMATNESGGRRYTTGLDLLGRRVVLVGQGIEVQRRLDSLLASGAWPHVVCSNPTLAVRSMAANGRISLESRPYRPEDLDGAWLVVACTGSPRENTVIAADAERRRILCTVDASQKDSERHAVLQVSAGVALVGGGPGDPELITVRGRRLLEVADLVVVDRLAPTSLLSELRGTVEVVDAAKIPRGPQMAQETINRILIDNARSGKFVVRLKGGDPYVFGRGYEELQACTAAGIAVTVVPGVTSAIAVPSSAGVPVTHRGLVHEFVVVSGHLPPGHPASMTDWHVLAKLRGTLVILMGIENIAAIARVLLSEGRSSHTPVAVIQEGTREGQRVARTDLRGVSAFVHENQIRPPAVVVVGEVAGLSSSENLEIKESLGIKDFSACADSGQIR